MSNNLSGKYNQKLFDNAKQSAKDVLKTFSKRLIQKTVEATGDLSGSKIANKITRITKNSKQKNSETVTNEHDK